MSNQPIVVITGSSQGIGAATARLFAANGWGVCINYVNSAAAARAVAADISRFAVPCAVVQADVAREAEVMRLFATVDSELGTLAALVNNAGILLAASRLMEMDAERLNRLLLTNVTSCFLCSREAVRRMSTREGGTGGAIVNVSSVAATRGGANGFIDYAATKGAMDSFTRGLALEVAAEGIRVNAVRPGIIATGIHARGGDPERAERLGPTLPMQRCGTPQEVAAAIYWLATNQASYVTGTFIDVTGGR